MGHTQKLMIAILGVFAAGFIMVGTNETRPRSKEKERQ